jgi:hypothetical protein
MKYLLLLIGVIGFAQAPIIDVSKYDATYPNIQNEWVNAGVTGGVPVSVTTYSTITALSSGAATSSLNGATTLGAEITACNAAGGGAIELVAGTYSMGTTQITLTSNVVLKGATGNADDVVLESSFRAGGFTDYFLQINGDSIGVEDLTIEYIGGATEPYDDISDPTPTFAEVYQNIDFVNYRVISVYFNAATTNSWVDNIKVIKSGSNPIRLDGNNNTVQNSVFDRAYNKGGGGAGYFHIVGDRNLIYNNTISRLRHISIEAPCCGFTAQYNVIVNNTIYQTDINYHDGDLGNNLVEGNIFNTESWNFNSGSGFETGRLADGHSVPASNNLHYNNDMTLAADASYATTTQVYKTTGAYNISGGANAGFETTIPAPIGGTFYPVTFFEANGTNKMINTSIFILD